MNFLMKMMLKFQIYSSQKRVKKECPSCKEQVIPFRGVSIVNIVGYILIGTIVYFISKNKLSFFLPVILSIINSYLSKYKCPKCRADMLEK